MLIKKAMKILFKFAGYLSFLIALFFSGCSKNNETKPSDNISHNDSTALVEIFKDMSKDNHTIIDIPSIPVPDEFLNSGNEYLQEVAELIEKFNGLIINPQNIDDTDYKSTESVNFTKNCETDGMFTECIYEEDHGEYKITADQNIGPGGTSLDIYYSGIYDGVDYGEMYEIEQYTISQDGKSMYIFIYKVPIPPESAGELAFYYSIEELDEKTIYTPWGEEHSRDMMYTSYIYIWDNVKKENHENIGCQEKWEGSTLTSNLINWSAAKEEIYISWISTWDFDKLEGEWCSYDDDELVKDCGPM
jgi:hypothetical protein